MNFSLLPVLVLLAGCAGDDAQPGSSDGTAGASTEVTDVGRDGAAESARTRKILFLGNSLSAGYGIDPDNAFPSLIQDRIERAGLNFEVVNAGVSGETTAGGLSRIKWLLQEQVDVLVIELGGNDGLRGIPPAATKANLQGIIDAARTHDPDIRIVLAGMKVPPNLGYMFSSSFERIYTELARENKVALIPFLLEDVGGVRRLNQADGIHPTVEGHRIIAETVWDTLAPILRDMSA